MSFPKRLNIGSGKNLKDNFLNLDIDDYWCPDIIYDLNNPLPKGKSQKFNTTRFGEVEIKKNMFEKIIAYDVVGAYPTFNRLHEKLPRSFEGRWHF